MQPREVITVAAVEKTFLPNVDIKKTQQRTERQALRKQLQATAAFDRRVTELAGAAVQKLVGGDARFPV